MMKRPVFFVLMLVTIVMLVTAAGCGPGSVIQINTPDSNSKSSDSGSSIQFYAPAENPLINTADSRGHISGILIGIWHGVISPVTLVMSFINPNVQMYEVHNNGSQYNLGFLIGVAIVFILLGALVGSRRR